MKLRNLKGAIRKTASVKFAMAGPMGRIDITCVKSDLMADLDRLYGSDGQAETGLWVNADGFLTRESDFAAPAAPEPTEEAADDDIDALLGGADVEDDFGDLLS